MNRGNLVGREWFAFLLVTCICLLSICLLFACLLSAIMIYLLFAIYLLFTIRYLLPVATCYLLSIYPLLATCLFACQCFCPFPHSPNACAKSPRFQANAFLIKHSALLILFFKKKSMLLLFFPFCVARYLLRAPRARSSPAHPSRPSHPVSLSRLTAPLPRRSLPLVETLRRNAKPRRPVPEN